MDQIFEAANGLAALMKQYDWYHRTTFEEIKQGNIWNRRLIVWGEGKKHKEIPKIFEGYTVIFRRVSRKHPCPFGSVKVC